MTAPPWSPWLTESRLAEGYVVSWYLRVPPRTDEVELSPCRDKQKEPVS